MDKIFYYLHDPKNNYEISLIRFYDDGCSISLYTSINGNDGIINILKWFNRESLTNDYNSTGKYTLFEDKIILTLKNCISTVEYSGTIVNNNMIFLSYFDTKSGKKGLYIYRELIVNNLLSDKILIDESIEFIKNEGAGFILFFDTETTGVPQNWRAPVNDLNNWPRLVQLAYIVDDKRGNRIFSGDFIIKPSGFAIPIDAARLHGISTERAIREGQSLSEVLTQFKFLINNSEVLVAHNMSFDEKIVGAEFLRSGLQNPIPNKRKICTMESSTNFCAINGPTGYKWPKLSELHYKLFGTGFDGAHNAAIDINATAKCFWELLSIGIIQNKISPEKATENEIKNQFNPTETLENSVLKSNTFAKPSIEWVEIPGGTFLMGKSESQHKPLEATFLFDPQHEVTLSSFRMSKYAVTFEQYDRFCEATGRLKPNDNGWGRGKRPVTNVKWDDAKVFAEWMGGRLPTEAEWEYACRAGTTTLFNTGDEITLAQANFGGAFIVEESPYPTYESDDIEYDEYYPDEYEDAPKCTMPVGSYPPNNWGLYEMHGNVWEWCSDYYGNYSRKAQINPSGPLSGNKHVKRGGSWSDKAESCSSVTRGYGSMQTYKNIGIRLVFLNKEMHDQDLVKIEEINLASGKIIILQNDGTWKEKLP